MSIIEQSSTDFLHISKPVHEKLEPGYYEWNSQMMGMLYQKKDLQDEHPTPFPY